MAKKEKVDPTTTRYVLANLYLNESKTQGYGPALVPNSAGRLEYYDSFEEAQEAASSYLGRSSRISDIFIMKTCALIQLKEKPVKVTLID